MKGSYREIENGISELKNAYREFEKVSAFNEIEKKQIPGGGYPQLKNREIDMAKTKLQYQSSIAHILISQNLSEELRSLRKEIIKQTDSSMRSAKHQRILTAAIIFIGCVSLCVAIYQILKVQ